MSVNHACRKAVYLVVALSLAATICRPARGAEITPDDVNTAIRRATAYLKGLQHKTQGSWTEYPGFTGGVSALCTLALLNAGVAPNDPDIQKALQYQRSLGNPEMTYVTSLQTMVFALASPQQDRLLIRRNVEWLEATQIKSGPGSGAWTYSQGQYSVKGDKSNSQFALLAMHEAERAGVKASQGTWKRALDYWLREQLADGSWSYFENKAGTGSMTCAGIASLIIAAGEAHDSDTRVENGRVACCGQQADQGELARAIEWMGRHFSVARNPGSDLKVDGGRRYYFYYLYGVERVGRMTGQRFFVNSRGRYDWYREGAKTLLDLQDSLTGGWKGIGHAESESLVATSFALLFLSKGRRPVVMAKLRHSEEAAGATPNDWDRHRGAVQSLVTQVEGLWKRDLTWQTIDARGARPEDLAQSPVLFLSGADALALTAAQKESLKIYLEQGGFLFAEACDGSGCDGAAFDRQFRRLMGEIFPGHQLAPLRPDHAVWQAEQRIAPDERWPLLGLDACCRTTVIYCPKTLSCYWELRRREASDYPPAIQKDIDYCLAVGANVLSYATGRELADKLEPPRISHRDGAPAELARGVLRIPKLSHTGGADDAPNTVPNLLRLLTTETRLPVGEERLVLSPEDQQLADYPLAFVHGRRAFRWTAEERKALARYLERGGTIFGDAICASPEFADAFRKEIEAALPGATWRRLPADHPIFSEEFGGFNVASVTLREPQFRSESDPLRARLSKVAPQIEAIELEGRLAVLFSPYDISCALESRGSLECKGYVREDAARLATNLILGVLGQ